MSNILRLTRGTTPARFTLTWPEDSTIDGTLTDCAVELFLPDAALVGNLTLEIIDAPARIIEGVLTLTDAEWRTFPRNSYFTVRVGYPNDDLQACERLEIVVGGAAGSSGVVTEDPSLDVVVSHGIPGVNDTETYNALKTYVQRDVVFYRGSSFWARRFIAAGVTPTVTADDEPVDSADWLVFARGISPRQPKGYEYKTVAALQGSEVLPGIKRVRVRAFSDAIGRGEMRLRRATLAEIQAAGYPALCYHRSVDRYTPSGTTDATQGGYWLWDEDVVEPEMAGAAGDVYDSVGVLNPTPTDDTAALQACEAYLYIRGGGIFRNPARLYGHSERIRVRQRIMVIGESCGYANQYVDVFARPTGSGWYLLPGSNCDGVNFEVDLSNGENNTEYRHGGGMRNMTLWGNRSYNPDWNDPDALDNNTQSLNGLEGYGLTIYGCRRVTLENVYCMMWAKEGIKIGSYEYVEDVKTSSNNIKMKNCFVAQNYENGADIACGDSEIDGLEAGNNRLRGYLLSTGMTKVRGGSCWNNGRDGINLTDCSAGTSIDGVLLYDNDECGLLASGVNDGVSIKSLDLIGNGRDDSAPSLFRAGIHIGEDCSNFSIQNCSALPQSPTYAAIAPLMPQRYGAYIDNPDHEVFFENFHTPLAHAAADVECTNWPLLNTQTNILNSNQRYNGGTFKDDIVLDGHAVQLVSGLSFDSWGTLTTLTANTVAMGSTSCMVLNVTGAATVTDITSSLTAGLPEPITGGQPIVIIRNISDSEVYFTYNANKLRLTGAADVILRKNEVIGFELVSGVIWQQIFGPRGGPPGVRLRLSTGQLIPTCASGGTRSTQVGTDGVMDGYIWQPRGDQIVTHASIYVSVAVPGAAAKVYIYDTNEYGTPRNLVAQSAEIDCSATGPVTVAMTVTATVRAPMQYWVFTHYNSTQTLLAWGPGQVPLLYATSISTDTGYHVIRRTQPYASGPPASINATSTIGLQNPIAVWLTVA